MTIQVLTHVRFSSHELLNTSFKALLELSIVYSEYRGQILGTVCPIEDYEGGHYFVVVVTLRKNGIKVAAFISFKINSREALHGGYFTTSSLLDKKLIVWFHCKIKS